ncbi:MAG: polynucleotide adenylyltransferase PcnB [Gammaproteobacteria bacterium]|nr:polynucleotide adenylyltransferase PcnB [Gammaproteobacteria bacterium]
MSVASKGNSIKNRADPVFLSRSEHSVSRKNISPNALKVLYRLDSAGFQACLVGGGVRDLILGREPKDFDIATDASPEQVRDLFRNCRLIGRRFRLAHVIYGREVIEVATFRAPHDDSNNNEDEQKMEAGRILRDNVYGSIDDDVWRRDFTINALYYDIKDYSIIDYVGGMQDIKDGLLRLIGDTEERYREDAVRMLRAIRFAAKLGFRIDPESERAIPQMGALLREIPSARIFEEVLKLFMSGAALETFELLRHYDLFKYLFPMTDESLALEVEHFPDRMLIQALKNTDSRIQQGKPVTPAFLYAALLWHPMQIRMQEVMTRDTGDEVVSSTRVMQIASSEIVREQVRVTSLPKRFSLPMREIWSLQHRFEQRAGKRPLRLLTHPRFRAAYDFLLLREVAGEVDKSLCDWWTEIQTLDKNDRESFIQQVQQPQVNSKKRRRRRKKAQSA